jgi:hypothetical protein
MHTIIASKRHVTLHPRRCCGIAVSPAAAAGFARAARTETMIDACVGVK